MIFGLAIQSTDGSQAAAGNEMCPEYVLDATVTTPRSHDIVSVSESEESAWSVVNLNLTGAVCRARVRA